MSDDDQNGFRAGAVECLHPWQWPWRSQDFWRAGLLTNKKNDIRTWLSWGGKEKLLGANKRDMEEAVTSKQLPADFFVDVTRWMWSVKEDGYFVKLIRDETTNEWSMLTRKDVKLTPPDKFLEGLKRNRELPSLMFGELVTCFTGCNKSDRNNTNKRTELRNQQFKILNKIFHKNKGPEAWVGLRVKIFAFPKFAGTMGQMFQHYEKVMLTTLHYHQHIGMCNTGVLENTQEAINIFQSVVQMGLEGIVIVNQDSNYGGLLNRVGDDACNIFKLKPKIVRFGEDLENTGKITDVKKDGVDQKEYEYVITIDGEKVKFTDMQNRDSKKKGSMTRIKYMEHAPAMGYDFPCSAGYRHLHFATDYDLSIEVLGTDEINKDPYVRRVLGVDDRYDRILNWAIEDDKKILEKSLPTTRLFNP